MKNFSSLLLRHIIAFGLAVYIIGTVVYFYFKPLEITFTDKDALGLQLSILEALISIGGIALAISGLFGYAVIKNQAVRKAEEVADKRFQEYIVGLMQKQDEADQLSKEKFITKETQEITKENSN